MLWCVASTNERETDMGCSICGAVDAPHTFGEAVDVPTGDGEFVAVGMTTLDGLLDEPIEVVDWVGPTESLAYVECDDCFVGEVGR